jgi:ABC-type polysaccharide/polyol phosphate transport system ATPase subunit
MVGMSSSPVIIRCRSVSKRFIYTPDTPQTVLESVIAALTHRGARRPQELWAVRDASFEVRAGESVGIVGRNGSGKSTMLKLITRILRPTSGTVQVNGRLSALLELGAGFHPDLTGRENIYMNGSLLGLRKEQIASRYNAIVAFSELEEFIDMPVKHYSSGMYMRLGFSVAVHVDPDILIVDEILAVGDQSFQTKCLERIHEMKQNGVTILMVSHNLDSVRTMCSHLIWMDHGHIKAVGPSAQVAADYLAHSSRRDGDRLTGYDNGHASSTFTRWGTGDIEICGVRFLDGQGNEQTAFKTGDAMTIEISYVAHKPIIDPEFGLGIYRQDGVHVNGPNNRVGGLPLGLVKGEGIVRYCIERLPLLPGLYQTTAAVHDSRIARAYDFHERAYPFRVVAGGTLESEGILALAASWQWQPLSEAVRPVNVGEKV